MPEISPSKSHVHPAKQIAPVGVEAAPASPPVPQIPYAELCTLTNFSFLRGASHPDELVKTARALGYAAIAITDEHSLAGVVRAHVAAKEAGLHLIVGALIEPTDAARLVLLARNRAGYGRLSRLLTTGRRRAPKGQCHLTRADVEAVAGHGDLLVIGLPDEAALLPQADARALDAAAARLAWMGAAFGAEASLGFVLYDGPDDAARMARLHRLAAMTRMPGVAVGAVEAHEPRRRAVRDVLCAVHHHCTVAELGHRVPAHGIAALRPWSEIERVFGAWPELIARTTVLAQACTFSLAELKYEYPVEGGIERLRALVEHHAPERWPQGVPAAIQTLMEHEISIIHDMAYAPYFLTVYEIVMFARSRGILCQGRGSAANSAICFCLGVTSVDPARFDLLFERFISRERREPPDIDIDFEHDRREEVLQWLFEKYGRDRAALTGTIISWRGRSAIRDVGKALGLSHDQVERLAGLVHWWSAAAWPVNLLREAGFDPEDPQLMRVLAIVSDVQGFPRHLSQHVGGVVLTAGRLDEVVPIENAAMDHRTVIQWDKDDLDALGIMKVDCLSLGMLTAIHKAFDLVRDVRGRDWTLATVPAEDQDVYAMASRADTVGVFQIESRAQMAMLPRLKPRNFYDMVIEVAIVRPGPIHGGMVHPYLRRRAGLEPVTYPSEAVRGVLAKTLGVPIFQEQAMRLAVVAAGFTPGEADALRRAMGAWRRPGLMLQYESRLMDGMKARGYAAEFAAALFKQLVGFGEYGFPESHAASFALLTYISCWLKYHEPASFACALLNSQPMGFYAPAQLVRDAREHGVPVRPADVVASDADSTLETDGLAAGAGPALRLGLRLVKGLSAAVMERVLAARQRAPFASVEDCRTRAGLTAADAARLARAGAFRSLATHRRTALWDGATLAVDAPLFEGAEFHDEHVMLPGPNRAEIVVADYASTGLSLESHPMALLRATLKAGGCVTADEVDASPSGRRVRVAGIVLNRQRPATASGIMFATLEDEVGHVNLIIRVREQEKYRAAVLSGRLLAVTGRVERAGEVVHLLASVVEDLTAWIATLPTGSRDFH